LILLVNIEAEVKVVIDVGEEILVELEEEDRIDTVIEK